MNEVCDLVPESYKEECDDFVAKYGTEIVEFLLSSAAPHTICALLHLCWFKEQPVPGLLHFYEYMLLFGPEFPTSTAKLTLITQSCPPRQTASHAARWLY